jgi:protein-disulfide isomerase
MDQELDKCKDYVAQKNVPWTNISEQMSADNKQPSMPEFYGITTMPTLILVGKDGNVIKNDVDIDTLKTTLAELFK